MRLRTITNNWHLVCQKEKVIMKTAVKTNTAHFETIKAITVSLFSAVLLSSLTALADQKAAWPTQTSTPSVPMINMQAVQGLLNRGSDLKALQIQSGQKTRLSVGGGSGNGNGDDAFALQTLAKVNPGLMPHEVLIEAFKQSEGRPVELNFRPAQDNLEYAYLLDTENQKAYWFSDLNTPASGERFVLSLVTVRSSVTDGPLLGGSHENGYIQDRNYKEFFNGNITQRITSIVTKSRDMMSHNIEYRQYNSKIIIFVTYPFVNPNTLENVCVTRSEKGLRFDQPVPSSGFCSIGYIWKD